MHCYIRDRGGSAALARSYRSFLSSVNHALARRAGRQPDGDRDGHIGRNGVPHVPRRRWCAAHTKQRAALR